MDTYIQQRAAIINAFDDLLAKVRTNSPNREVLQAELMSYIGIISLHTENLWVQNATNNEVFTRRFLGRKSFGSPEIHETAQRENIDTPAAAVPQAQAEANKALANQGRRQLINIASKYDIRQSLRATLDINYIDERGPADKRPLEIWRYNELISNDALIRIVRWMVAEHHFGPLLMFWTVLAATKEYVQFAINPTVMSLMFDLIADDPSPFTTNNVYTPAIQRAVFYMMHILYKEECYLRSYMMPEHRCLIDLEAACRLPKHDGPIEESPYVPLSLAPQILTNKAPLLKSIYETAGTWRGFYDTAEFKRRFRVFTGGLFDDLNTDKLWICGSCIPACAVRSPLEQLFIQSLDKDDNYILNDNELNAYFEEFYPSLVALEHTYFDINTEMTNAEVEAAVSDVDIIVHVADDEEFDKHAKRIFEHVKNKIAQAWQTDNTVVQLRKIDTAVSYKYYLSIDKGTVRWPGIEIFRVFETHPIGAISRFHVPAVRGSYDGNTVKVLPSIIAFAMSGYFMDFRWVSCIKNAKDILLRYHLRGGTFIMNDNEITDLQAYIESSSKWAPVRRYLLSSSRDINNPLYKPRVYGHTFWKDLKEYERTPINEKSRYSWVEPSTAETATVSNLPKFGPLRYQNGSIQPISLWIIRAYAEALMRSATFN